MLPQAFLKQLCDRITEKTGVQLGAAQQAMVVSRLSRRIAELKLTELKYVEYFNQYQEKECDALVSVLTTHHTFFFREWIHFEYLEKTALPKLIPEVRKRADKILRVWSAASSKGQEAYSLAMFLVDYLKNHAPDVQFEILGTDVDPQSVQFATNGVYRRDEIKEIPMKYLTGNWLKGTGAIEDYVRAGNPIRKGVRFEVFNLIKQDHSKINQKYDVILCRNVFIYFTPKQVEEATQGLFQHLDSNGYFIIGVSESLAGLNVPVTLLSSAVYGSKVAKVQAAVTTTNGSAAISPTISSVVAGPIRVFAIDDSPTILTLFKQVFKLESGFILVGTAKNGLEAQQNLKRSDVDVVTLDIHMPEMDGIQYLEKNFGPNHPPVVMISSVSRDDSNLALKALELGASDFVEKPTMANLSQKSEEIRFKLKSAISAKTSLTSSIDKTFFKKTLPLIDPTKSLRVFYSTLSDRSKILGFFKDLKGAQAPSILIIDGLGEALQSSQALFAKDLVLPVKMLSDAKSGLESSTIYIADLKSAQSLIAGLALGRIISYLVYGALSAPAKAMIEQIGTGQALIEDIQGADKTTFNSKNLDWDVTPATSFAYMSAEFLSGSSAVNEKKVAA